ncbi:MAG: hypothetical protein QME75_05555 [Deltaproteobacteria bacterium]|nr:hypothetical protein [Deltaproteobacteria bacterium]
MDLSHAIRLRSLAGYTAAFFCLLIFLAVLDGLIAKFREPFHVFYVLPGAVAEINGPLPESVKQVEALAYISNSPNLKIEFETLHSGYFLGGNMWRGRLVVSPDTPPGKYVLAVRLPEGSAEKPPPPYGVVVFADQLSLRKNSRSLLLRHTGLSPWLAAGFFIPFLLVNLLVVFRYSRRIEGLLAEKGLAEIYKVVKGEGFYILAFGLGTEHGLTLGQEFAILDPEGRQVGYGKVQEISPTDAIGRTWMEQIMPGYLVSLKREH